MAGPSPLYSRKRGRKEDSAPAAQVFRKSAKKARADAAGEPSSPARPGRNGKGRDDRQAGQGRDNRYVRKFDKASRGPQPAEGRPKAAKLADLKQGKKQQQQQQTPKQRDGPKAKTHHQYIAQKQAERRAETEAAKAKAVQAAEKKAKNGATKRESQNKNKGKAKAAAGAPAAPLPPPTSFRIVAGSYERILYGLQATFSPAEVGDETDALQATLKPIFVFPAHVSCIRSVACAGMGSKWLATGGTDEAVKVWDLRKKVEVGGLVGHEGACGGECECAWVASP